MSVYILLQNKIPIKDYFAGGFMFETVIKVYHMNNTYIQQQILLVLA